MCKKHVGNCRFNDGINCDAINPPCYRCGWNPKVSKQRLKNIKSEVKTHEKFPV